MSNNADHHLDALLAAVRNKTIDTSRAEFGFETRLMARLREDRSPWTAVAAVAWRLCPFFAALAIAATIWCRIPAVRADADTLLLAEASRGGEERVLLSYLTGDKGE